AACTQLGLKTTNCAKMQSFTAHELVDETHARGMRYLAAHPRCTKPRLAAPMKRAETGFREAKRKRDTNVKHR
ncbi:MAG: hypothetical protein ABJP82_00040, partial [Hyphomicrobiales bacterium]